MDYLMVNIATSEGKHNFLGKRVGNRKGKNVPFKV